MKIKITRFLLRDNPSFFKSARKIFTKYATLFVSPARVDSQIAVVASKKQIALATQRNYSKRKMKSVLTDVLQETKPLIIVAIVHKSILLEKYEIVRTEIKKSVYGF